MRAFRFSMQRVLDVREAEQQRRRSDLAQAENDLRAEQRQLQRLVESLEQVLRQQAENAPCLTVELLYRRHQFLVYHRQVQAEQRERVQRAREQRDTCRQRLERARVEVKKLEKLKERQWHEWCAQFRHEENKLHDEAAIRLQYYHGEHEELRNG